MMRQQISRGGNETLVYVQAMLGELRIMAKGENFDMLAYLIEMAYGEATDMIRGNVPLDARRAPLRIRKEE